MEQVFASDRHSPPNVRSYLSVTTFLQNYFEFRKKISPMFSYEEWAAELGFKSRTYMRLLCQGKRSLTADFIDIFSQKNKFSKDDKEHLILLSLYDQAQDTQYKEIYMSKILSGLRCNEYQMDLKDYTEFLSHPQLPLMHLVLAVNNLKATEEKLAHLLDESVENIKARLKVLEKMDLVFQEDNIWLAKKRSFKIKDENRNQAVALYNKETLKESESFISRDDVKKRFRSVFFAFNENHIAEIDKDIESFLSLLKNKYSSPKSGDDRYFKMNLQLYPVTESLQIETSEK